MDAAYSQNKRAHCNRHLRNVEIIIIIIRLHELNDKTEKKICDTGKNMWKAGQMQNKPEGHRPQCYPKDLTMGPN